MFIATLAYSINRISAGVDCRVVLVKPNLTGGVSLQNVL